ncbi:hypothetical protein [Mucilaginibacter gynuensis]|uniref:hypothetical protein n=1 Tax=Mucilaginibacter gynuensis TaxID=1302236 RepID=UPI0031ECA539
MMKRIKINFAVLALLSGAGAALAFKTPEPRAHKVLQQYANTSTTATTHWILNSRTKGLDPGQYRCTAASKACTAWFTSQPADGTAAPVSPDTEAGQYVINP